MFSYNTFNKLSVAPGTHRRSVSVTSTMKKTIWSLLASVVVVTLVHFSHSVASADSISKRYTVQPGDTLWTISQKLSHGGDLRDVVAAIEDANGFGDSNRLYPGQVIEIPGN